MWSSTVTVSSVLTVVEVVCFLISLFITDKVTFCSQFKVCSTRQLTKRHTTGRGLTFNSARVCCSDTVWPWIVTTRVIIKASQENNIIHAHCEFIILTINTNPSH